MKEIKRETKAKEWSDDKHDSRSYNYDVFKPQYFDISLSTLKVQEQQKPS
jgi:hypothetical protein